MSSFGTYHNKRFSHPIVKVYTIVRKNPQAVNKTDDKRGTMGLTGGTPVRGLGVGLPMGLMRRDFIVKNPCRLLRAG